MPLINLIENGLLPLLIIEGGLSAADVKLLRHVSSSISAGVKIQIKNYPLLFDRSNYLLKSFENAAAFSTMHFKYGYSTPADIIERGGIVNYKDKTWDKSDDEMYKLCMKILTRNNIDSPYRRENFKDVKPRKFDKFINAQDFADANVGMLLQLGREEEAAKIYLSEIEHDEMIDSNHIVLYAIKIAAFKFVSLVMLGRHKNSYIATGQSTYIDVFVETFTHPAALDFYCKFYMPPAAAGIPYIGFWGSGVTIDEKWRLCFIKKIVSFAPDEVLYFLYKLYKNKDPQNLKIPLDTIFPDPDDGHKTLIYMFKDLFTSGVYDKKEYPPLIDNNRAAVLLLAALQQRNDFFIFFVNKYYSKVNKRHEANMIKFHHQYSHEKKLLLPDNSLAWKIYIVIIASFFSNNYSILTDIILNSEYGSSHIAPLLTQVFNTIFESSSKPGAGSWLNYNDNIEKNNSMLHHNLVIFLNKILKYTLPISVCKSLESPNYWEILFYNRLKCSCGGAFHKERAWNMPPGR